MRRRWFIGQTQDWLETELSKAQSDLAAGSASTGGAEGDVSFTEQMTADATSRIDALLFELSFLDPVKYPRSVAVGARVTRGVFGSSASASSFCPPWLP